MLGLQIRVRMPQDKRREFLQAVEFFSCQPSGSEDCIQKKTFRGRRGANPVSLKTGRGQRWRRSAQLDCALHCGRQRRPLQPCMTGRGPPWCPTQHHSMGKICRVDKQPYPSGSAVQLRTLADQRPNPKPWKESQRGNHWRQGGSRSRGGPSVRPSSWRIGFGTSPCPAWPTGPSGGRC